MDPQWALGVFARLQRITPDPELAETCRRIVQRRSRTPIMRLPRVLPEAVVLRSPLLFKTLAELRRRKRVGEPYEPWLEQLDGLMRTDGARGWSRFWLTQRLQIITQLDELGLDPPGSFEQVTGEIRSIWQQGDPDALVAERPFMFALTHVFTAASGDFRRYVDPERFVPETAMLRHALQRYLSVGVPEDRLFLDIQAQVVTSLALQRLPEDEQVRAMVERLLAAQNEDGSWGEDVARHLAHATFVVAKALIDLPPRLGAHQRRGAATLR